MMGSNQVFRFVAPNSCYMANHSELSRASDPPVFTKYCFTERLAGAVGTNEFTAQVALFPHPEGLLGGQIAQEQGSGM